MNINLFGMLILGIIAIITILSQDKIIKKQQQAIQKLANTIEEQQQFIDVLKEDRDY